MDWYSDYMIITYLVGGLEHEFYDLPYIGNKANNWLSYVSEGWLNHQPEYDLARLRQWIWPHIMIIPLIDIKCIIIQYHFETTGFSQEL
jgi:hypothetical protein